MSININNEKPATARWHQAERRKSVMKSAISEIISGGDNRMSASSVAEESNGIEAEAKMAAAGGETGGEESGKRK